MRQVEIPGGTAMLRDERGELRWRQKVLLDAAMVAALGAFQKAQDRSTWEGDGLDVRSANLTIDDSVRLMERQNAMIVAVLVSWTLDDPLPTIDTIGDLEVPLAEGLVAAVTELSRTTNVFHPTNFNPAPGENPTVNSRDSDESVREPQESDLNSKPSNGGESTATARSSKSRTKSS